MIQWSKSHTSKTHIIDSEKSMGRTLSRVSISLENLESTLPLGVVSKKDKGKCNTEDRTMSCMIFAAFQQARSGTKSVNIETGPTVKTG